MEMSMNGQEAVECARLRALSPAEPAPRGLEGVPAAGGGSYGDKLRGQANCDLKNFNLF